MNKYNVTLENIRDYMESYCLPDFPLVIDDP